MDMVQRLGEEQHKNLAREEFFTSTSLKPITRAATLSKALILPPQNRAQRPGNSDARYDSKKDGVA